MSKSLAIWLSKKVCLNCFLESCDIRNPANIAKNPEVFKISKIQLSIRVTYKITDLNGEEMEGSFYEQELQKTAQDTIRLEKRIKKTRR